MRSRSPAAAWFAWLFCVMLAGCSSLGFSPTTATQAPAPTAAPQATAQIARPPAPADTLRWSIEGVSDISSLDPAIAGDNPTVTVLNFVFGGLVRLNSRLEVEPNDAETWEASADGKTYTFTLREGLKFADGTAVSAQDYVFSINRAIQPETKSYGAPSQLAGIVGAADVISGAEREASGIRALDDTHLQIELIEPSASFLQQLTFPYMFVLPQHQVENDPNWLEEPFGTGPYTVDTWTRGQSILLRANPNFWQGTAGVEKIQMIFSSESQPAFEHYLAGQLDIMGSLQNPLPAALLPHVRDTPDFRTSPALSTRYIGFNNMLPPFNSDDVRRAFALAINREAIAEQILGGEAVAATRILPPGMVGTSLNIRALSFDAQAAKDALTAAGFPNGQGLPPITLTYAPEGGENEVVVQALKRDWAQNLGVEITLNPVDTSQLSSALDTTWATPEKGLQMYYSVWGADYADPQNFLSLQLHTDSRYNNGHFSDQRFDRAVEEADNLSDRTMIQRRLLLYNQAEQIAIDRVGWLPILHPKVHLLINPRVEGLSITPNGLMVTDWTALKLHANS